MACSNQAGRTASRRSFGEGGHMVRQFSAGGVVFRKKDNQILWLLIQPARKDESQEIRWQLPKGWVDEGEKMEGAALREVAEEGGVKARVINKVGSFQIFFHNSFESNPPALCQNGTGPAGGREKVLKTITFYLMEYLEEEESGHDKEVAKVEWLPFEEAKERLTFKSEKETLEKAKGMMENESSQKTLFNE